MTSPDYRGFPNMTIEYALTDAEHAEIAAATERLRRAGRALGEFVAEPRLLPNGSSLHYMGTYADRRQPTTARRSPTRGRGCGASTGSSSAATALIPTANTMNPTLMSVAIAVRGARKLVEELAAQPVSASA